MYPFHTSISCFVDFKEFETNKNKGIMNRFFNILKGLELNIIRIDLKTINLKFIKINQ
jgi:hypothetical protein